jgi:hypothetical protein
MIDVGLCREAQLEGLSAGRLNSVVALYIRHIAEPPKPFVNKFVCQRLLEFYHLSQTLGSISRIGAAKYAVLTAQTDE